MLAGGGGEDRAKDGDSDVPRSSVVIPGPGPDGPTEPPGEHFGDLAAVGRIAAGDMSAAEDLFLLYRGDMSAVARKLVQPCDVDDVVAEAFASVLAAIAAGGGPTSNTRAYLTQSVRNAACALHRRGRRVSPSGEMEDLLAGQVCPDSDPWGAAEGVFGLAPASGTATGAMPATSPSAAFAATPRSASTGSSAITPDDVSELGLGVDEAEWISRAYQALSPKWQTVLRMVVIDGIPTEQVARRLGTSTRAVSALCGRARDGLRRKYVELSHTVRTPECRHVLKTLLSEQAAASTALRAQRHLDGCDECRALRTRVVALFGRHPKVALVGAGITGTAAAVQAALAVSAPTPAAAARRRPSGQQASSDGFSRVFSTARSAARSVLSRGGLPKGGLPRGGLPRGPMILAGTLTATAAAAVTGVLVLGGSPETAVADQQSAQIAKVAEPTLAPAPAGTRAATPTPSSPTGTSQTRPAPSSTMSSSDSQQSTLPRSEATAGASARSGSTSSAPATTSSTLGRATATSKATASSSPAVTSAAPSSQPSTGVSATPSQTPSASPSKPPPASCRR